MQTRQAAGCQTCSTNRDLQTKLDVDNMSGDKNNIPDYLNSSTNNADMPGYLQSSDNEEADKRT